VARELHWHLCKYFYIPLLANSWFCHHPLPVSENVRIKLLWDFTVVTDGRILCNRPDIVVFLKQEKYMLLKVSCLADVIVVEKEEV